MKNNRQRDSRHKWLIWRWVWDDGRTFNGGRSGGDGGYGGVICRHIGVMHVIQGAKSTIVSLLYNKLHGWGQMGIFLFAIPIYLHPHNSTHLHRVRGADGTGGDRSSCLGWCNISLR